MEVKTDRELLELVAMSAGAASDEAGVYWVEDEPWNPLHDDGDALRLAVKLRLDIEHNDGGVYANDGGFGHWQQEDYGDNPAAATRRAIVRAAAELARKGAE